MKKIEAVIRKSKFEDVKMALYEAGIEWFSYWDITGLGKSKEDQVVRGQIFQSSYIQRRMLSIVVRDINLEKTVIPEMEKFLFPILSRLTAFVLVNRDRKLCTIKIQTEYKFRFLKQLFIRY